MHKVQLKIPFTGAAILPGVGADIIKAPETEKLRTKRQNVATRLEAVTGKVPTWHQREYCYRIELTPEQVEEVGAWTYVRHVKEIE
jgi:hypothetical protein